MDNYLERLIVKPEISELRLKQSDQQHDQLTSAPAAELALPWSTGSFSAVKGSFLPPTV